MHLHMLQQEHSGQHLTGNSKYILYVCTYLYLRMHAGTYVRMYSTYIHICVCMYGLTRGYCSVAKISTLLDYQTPVR